MKKLKFILSAIAALGMITLAGCDMTIDNPVEGLSADLTGAITVSLAGENTLNVSSVTLNGTEVDGLAEDGFMPSSWSALDDYMSVTGVTDGDVVKFTFTQPTVGSGAWNTWAVAFTDTSGKFGNLLRADTWINPTTPWSKGGIWSDGGTGANSVYYNSYTYMTCGASLPTDATVIVTVEYKDKYVTVTETVNGTVAQISQSANWN